MTLRKLLSPGQPWKLREHFVMSIICGLVVIGGLLLLLSNTGPPTLTVTPEHPAKAPHELVLDPATPYPLAPIPFKEK